MQTLNADSRQAARWLLLFVAFLAETCLCGVVLNHDIGGVFGSIEKTSDWFRGGAKPEVVTWPMWGYSGLLAVIPSHACVIAIQSLLGALALTFLIQQLSAEMSRYGWLFVALGLLGIPWHTIQMEMYPSGLAGTWALLGIMCLARSITLGEVRWAVLAGVCAGISQNFRSEFVMLPAFLLGLTILAYFFGQRCHLSMRLMGLYAVIALAVQLPWSVFYYTQTARVSLSESNLGAVLYISLGSDPRNPWGITGNDGDASEALEEAGFSCSWVSEEGNQILKRMAVEKIISQPGSFVRRTFRQLRSSLIAPFSWGEPDLDDTSSLHLDVLREGFKVRLGIGVNQREVNDYLDRGLLPAAESDTRAILALIYQFATMGVGFGLMTLGLVGIALTLFRVVPVGQSPLLLLLGATFIYKVALNVLLFYQVKYLNNVYPMLIPFAGIALASTDSWTRGILRRSVRQPR